MNYWSDKQVLITGATGFVGYWLTRKLIEKESRVVALVRDHDPQSALYRSGLIEEVAVVSGQLESLDTLERAICEFEIDTVFHLGAQTIVETALKAPHITFEANIRGTYLLLEACRRQKVESIVIASSDKAYGSSSILPYSENTELVGRFPYDVSKTCCDLLAQSYVHTYQLPLTIARCGNIYGGGDMNWSRIIPGTIRSLMQGKAPIIRSDGTFIRDYLYVQDAVEAYLLLGEKGPELKGEAFNFAPSRPHTVLEIVNLLLKLMDCEYMQPEIQNRVQAEIKDQYLSSKKAHQILEWKPIYSLEDGLRETIDWYQSHLNRTLYAVH
jgi:CDP-glucose 4,6-dehydratase